MGGLIVAGEIKTPNLIDMLVFAYAHRSRTVIIIVTFGLPVHISGKFARSYTK